MKQLLYQRVRSLFNDYYLSLEEGVAQAQADPIDEKGLENIKSRIEAQLNAFFQIPEFATAQDRDGYLQNVQARLHAEGYFLDITPQYGIDTGKLNLTTVDNISLRPIIEQHRRGSRLGQQEIEYDEYLLGENLISLPHFIEPLVESASSSEVAIFPVDLQKSLDNDYAIFHEYNQEVDRRFEAGLVSVDNLFCVTLKLHQKQWGAAPPGAEARNLLMQHFRLHGEQHVADFGLIHTGKRTFSSEDPALTESLNQDSLLEARVWLRQILSQSLPYYVLGQIIRFEVEWLNGSRSEYAWAGHILFLGLSQASGSGEDSGKFWAAGVENWSAEGLGQLAGAFATRRGNFKDMLD